MMTSGKTNSFILRLTYILILASLKGNCQTKNIQAQNFIRIKLLNANNFLDETILRFLDGSTKGFDPNTDSFKLLGAQLNVFIQPDSNLSLAINAVPFPGVEDSIDIAFTGNYGNYRFVFADLNSFTTGLVLVLTDKFTHTQMILQNSDTVAFAVTIDPDSYHYRFKIKYYFPTASGKEIVTQPILNFIAKCGDFFPESLRKSGKNISWYSVDGHRIKTNHNSNEAIPNFPPGLFFLRTEEDNPKNIKVLIRN